MGYSEDMKRERIADSWRLRMQGPNAHTSTIGGAMEAKQMNANLPRPSATNYFPPASPSRLQPGRLYDPGRQVSTPAAPAQQRGGAPGAPLFPSVDTAFNRIPPKFYWLLCIVGAICGLGYAGSIGVASGAAVGTALIGAFAGLLLIPLLRLGVKIVLCALALGVCGLVVYFLYQALR